MKAGAWSQYLEVGIGPDAEVFTKSQPMSAVGTGDDAGFHRRLSVEQSRARGRDRGCIERRDCRRDARQRRQSARFRGALRAPARQGEGSERELRDRPVLALLRQDVHPGRREGGRRSLWWSMARTDSASKAAPRWPRSAAIRPISPRKRSARTTPIRTASSCCSGTMFAPVADRGAPGKGFTHKSGDIVTISDGEARRPRQSHAAVRQSASAGRSAPARSCAISPGGA